MNLRWIGSVVARREGKDMPGNQFVDEIDAYPREPPEVVSLGLEPTRAAVLLEFVGRKFKENAPNRDELEKIQFLMESLVNRSRIVAIWRAKRLSEN